MKKELIEYYALNLSEFLINRTINIQLKVENDGRINLYIMNSTQFEYWKNNFIPMAEISKEKLQDTQLLFSPKNTWGRYYLVLINPENNDLHVHIEIFQEFIVKVLDYNYAFTWLEISLVSLILLLILPFPLRVTLDDIMDRITCTLLPAKYRDYAEEYICARRLQVFHMVLTLATFILFIVNLYISSLLNRFILVDDIWRDYWYRYSILSMILCVMFLIIFSLTVMLWNLFYLPLNSKYYPDLRVYKKHIKIYSEFLGMLLKGSRSIIFYFILSISIFVICILNQEMDFPTFLCLCILPFMIYLGYVTSLAYFKTQRKVATKPDIDFKRIKASYSTFILISVIGINILFTSLPLLNLVSQRILDRSILIAKCSISGIWTSEDILVFFNNILPTIAYSIPLIGLFLYYSFIFFSILLRRKKEFMNICLPVNVLAECIWDLTFFFTVFRLSLWLQFLITPLNFKKILISLISSFIASSFREYLRAMKST